MFIKSSPQMKELEDKGWFVKTNAFGEEFRIKSINWLRAAVKRAKNDPALEPEFEANSSGENKPVRKLRRLLWNDFDFWIKILELSGIFDLGRSLIRRKPSVIYHAAFLKSKSVGSAVGFHQDQGLWTYDYPDAFNVWIALTNCDSENGCLELFPGSHLFGLIPHVKESTHPWHPVVSTEKINLGRPMQIQMSAGDVIIWHRYLIHGSGPNLSNQDRLGMVLVFADASRPNFEAKDVYKL
jgi:hypothetical protein